MAAAYLTAGAAQVRRTVFKLGGITVLKTILEIIGGAVTAALILLVWALAKAAGMASREEERWEHHDD